MELYNEYLIYKALMIRSGFDLAIMVGCVICIIGFMVWEVRRVIKDNKTFGVLAHARKPRKRRKK